MLMGLSVAPILANMSTALMNNVDDRGYILADGLNSLSACFLQLSLGDHFYLVLVHNRMYKFAGSIDLLYIEPIVLILGFFSPRCLP